MLVLNRRPGESVIIEPGVRVTVLSVADRRVRISLSAPDVPEIHVSAVVASADAARLEVGPIGAITFDRDAIRVDTAPDGHPASGAEAAIALNRGVGQRVHVGDGAWVAVASIAKGNPCVAFGGDAIGEELRITLIRPAGSYVRLGVEAPSRRVYREELWEAMHAGPADATPAIGATRRADGAGAAPVGPGEGGPGAPRPNGHDAGVGLEAARAGTATELPAG